jgi:hypothetical protein
VSVFCVTHSLSIERDYRGRTLPPAQHAQIVVQLDAESLTVEVDAPYFGDPAPPGPVGPTDGLWEYEVSELFVADAAERYLEIELSPHGHHLVLELQGVRRVTRTRLPIDSQVTLVPLPAAADAVVKGRYRGRARVPARYLPAQPTRANAYLIHGQGSERTYHAHSPPWGERPDFHRLESFVPLRFAP